MDKHPRIAPQLAASALAVLLLLIATVTMMDACRALLSPAGATFEERWLPGKVKAAPVNKLPRAPLSLWGASVVV